MNITMLGTSKFNDTAKEEMVYTFGQKNEMPIALYLALLGEKKGKNQVERLFSIFTYDEKACSYADEFKKLNDLDKFIQNIDDEIEKEKKEKQAQFLEGKPFTLKEDGKKSYNLKDLLAPCSQEHVDIHIRGDHAPIPISVYSHQFIKMLALRTSYFNNYSNGVVLACPKSYMNFWGSSEFKNVNESIDIAFEFSVEKAMEALIKEGYKINTKNYTICVEGYQPIQIINSYAW